MKRTPVDPFPGPAWLAPHKHPALFPRQVFGVRFRWPGLLAWGVLAATMVLAVWSGWNWLPLVPATAMALRSGVLTNAGKPLAGAWALMLGLVLVNIALVAVLIVASLLVQALGLA